MLFLTGVQHHSDRAGYKGISKAVKRQITQGLQKDHGIAIADTCKFFDFETCEEIYVIQSEFQSFVRCIAC